MDLHRLGELRSLAYHRVIAERLDGETIDRARKNAKKRAADGSEYAERWLELLDGPIEELRAALVDEGETMVAMRSSSPFAGALGPRERWRIHREVREREA
jgi:hypothetical protein